MPTPTTMHDTPTATSSTAPHPFFTRDPRVVRVVEYLDGWVPNAYKWPAEGNCNIHTRRADGTFSTFATHYDRKRSYGRGPSAVGFSERGGRLLSH